MFVRDMDSLGRVVIPMEIRRTMAINPGDGIEIFAEHDTIMLRKHISVCFYCNGVKGVKQYNKAYLCEVCSGKLTGGDGS